MGCPLRLSLAAEPHVQFLGCRLCWENHPLVASLRPLTAPCKACVHAMSGQRLAVHSNLSTGLRVETKLLSTRTLAHTHTHFPHTHTLSTHTPSVKTSSGQQFCVHSVSLHLASSICSQTHAQHTHTHQHTSQSRCTKFGWTALLCPLDLFPPVLVLVDLCRDACAHQHMNAPHQAFVCSLDRSAFVCSLDFVLPSFVDLLPDAHKQTHTHTHHTHQRCTQCGCSEFEWMALWRPLDF